MEPNPLERWLVNRFAQYPQISKSSLSGLANETRNLVKLYMSRAESPRPSKITEHLTGLAGHFQKASKAVEKMGDEGMVMLLAASGANNPPDGDWHQHAAYLNRMALLASKALEVSKAQTRSTLDYKGGRKGDERLQSLAVIMADRYQVFLGIKPTYTINPETGYGNSDFILFVKEALRHFAPDSKIIDGRTVDRAVQRAIPKSPCEPWKDEDSASCFIPPKYP